MFALSITPAAIGSLLPNLEVVATVLIAAFVFGEGIGRRVALAIGLVTAGGMLLSYEREGAFGLSVGALAIMGACLLWGIDTNSTPQISGKNPISIVKGLGAGPVTFAAAFLTGESVPAIGTVLFTLLLGAACNGASRYRFILALRHLGSARTAVVFRIAPFAGSGLRSRSHPSFPSCSSFSPPPDEHRCAPDRP
jgi:drug/metabolite transporter (DMT)-like permease